MDNTDQIKKTIREGVLRYIAYKVHCREAFHVSHSEILAMLIDKQLNPSQFGLLNPETFTKGANRNPYLVFSVSKQIKESEIDAMVSEGLLTKSTGGFMPKQSYGITIKGAHFIHDAELVSAFEALDRAREASQKVSLASVRSVLVQALGQDSDKAQRILAQLTDPKVLSR